MVTSKVLCIFKYVYKMHVQYLFSLTASVYIDREVLVITYEYDLKTNWPAFQYVNPNLMSSKKTYKTVYAFRLAVYRSFNIVHI